MATNRINRVEAARQRKANQRHGPNGETRPKDKTKKKTTSDAAVRWNPSRKPVHAQDCQCEMCERRRQALIDAAVRFREWRKTHSSDLGDSWDIAQHRLARFMATTTVTRARGKPGTPEPKQTWIQHLDEFSLNRAVDRLGAEYPLYGRIVVQYFYNDKTQDEIAEKEHMDQSTVSRYLKAAVQYLGVLYVGLDENPYLMTPTG